MVLFDTGSVFDWPGEIVNDTFFDDEEGLQSVPGNTTITLKSYSGSGFALIEVYGDGDGAVNIMGSVDGGPDTLICGSNQVQQAPLAFQISLVIKAKNTNALAKNAATVSQTGVMG